MHSYSLDFLESRLGQSLSSVALESFPRNVLFLTSFVNKVQLIPFSVIVSTKIPTIFYKDFCPSEKGLNQKKTKALYIFFN